GNQAFAIDWIKRSAATGFLAGDPVVDPAAVDHAWYRYRPPGSSILTQ
ncbi:MAG: hypothetical protein HZB15_02870, partial [Actinobacteria bacterium]|nr:hypothetical protein [Actinomycetota bacterium]